MKILIFILCLFLASCGCPVDVGDRVEKRSDGNTGLVIAIDNWGGATSNCVIAVHHDDGTLTDGFVYNWAYKRVEE